MKYLGIGIGLVFASGCLWLLADSTGHTGVTVWGIFTGLLAFGWALVMIHKGMSGFLGWK